MNAPRLRSTAVALALLILPQIVSAAGTVISNQKKVRSVKRASAAHHVVPFIADDLDRALADAKKTNRPIFVESWAPW